MAAAPDRRAPPQGLCRIAVRRGHAADAAADLGLIGSARHQKTTWRPPRPPRVHPSGCLLPSQDCTREGGVREADGTELSSMGCAYPKRRGSLHIQTVWTWV